MRNFSAVAVVVLASCFAATYACSVSTISNPTTYPMGYDTWRCGNTSGRLVLTFDDNPGQYGYDSVLTMGSYLKSRSIRAMFFLTTKDMVEAKRMDVIAKLRKMGHYVGNHSYDHADFYKLSDANFKRELTEGVSGNMLRPPFGSYTSHQKELARQLGMRICTWHARLSTHDWDIVNPATGERRSVHSIRQLVQNAPASAKSASGGGVILGHLWSNYPKAIPGILDDMRKQGHSFCRNRGPVNASGIVPFPMQCT